MVASQCELAIFFQRLIIRLKTSLLQCSPFLLARRLQIYKLETRSLLRNYDCWSLWSATRCDCRCPRQRRYEQDFSGGRADDLLRQEDASVLGTTCRESYFRVEDIAKWDLFRIKKALLCYLWTGETFQIFL